MVYVEDQNYTDLSERIISQDLEMFMLKVFIEQTLIHSENTG